LIEGIPVDVALTCEFFVAPAQQQLQVIFPRVFPIPVDVFVLGNSSLALRTPDFSPSRQKTLLFICPVVEGTGDHLLGVIANS